MMLLAGPSVCGYQPNFYLSNQSTRQEVLSYSPPKSSDRTARADGDFARTFSSRELVGSILFCWLHFSKSVCLLCVCILIRLPSLLILVLVGLYVLYVKETGNPVLAHLGCFASMRRRWCVPKVRLCCTFAVTIVTAGGKGLGASPRTM